MALPILALLLACLGSSLALPPPPSVSKAISRDLSKVKYDLHTRANPAGVRFDRDEHDRLSDVGFEPQKGTVLLMHGFSSDETFGDRFISELLKGDDINVIVIQWKRLAESPYYLTASENTIEVGEYTGRLVARLVKQEGVDPESIHCVGHSLGSHGCSHLGKRVKDITNKKIGRISALDPARPWWSFQLPFRRLNEDDAKLVAVWHTNSGRLVEGCLSFKNPQGHVDFYPNGGEHQPGCIDPVCEAEDDCSNLENGIAEFVTGGCSHDRAVAYFIESINADTKFVATLCGNYNNFQRGQCRDKPTVEMGYNLGQKVAHGKYFLDVNSEAPFALRR